MSYSRNTFLSCLAITLWVGFGWSVGISLISTFTVYLITGGWRFARIFVMTFPRDLQGLYYLLFIGFNLKKQMKNNEDIVSLFRKNVKKSPHKKAFVMVDGCEMTFLEVENYSNAIANYYLGTGLVPGDTVALYLQNCIEYPCIWLGLAKIGVKSALINCNQQDDALVHSIQTVNSKAVIFHHNLKNAVMNVKSTLSKGTKYYCMGYCSDDEFECVRLDVELKSCSMKPPPVTYKASYKDHLLYIYTSGTTGLPKAAIITHIRYNYLANVHCFLKTNSTSILYCTLPLYHSAGGILGISGALIFGCTVVIRKKFSASNFWKDCVTYKCTNAQYIGEICRYLLTQPESPFDTQHNVKVIIGNGLRPQIWKDFQKRFQIKQIIEFYGATESNSSLLNWTNTVGSVGCVSRILPSVYPIKLIKVDEYTGEPMRNSHGLCMTCEPGEAGQLVGKIFHDNPIRQFDGYVDKCATNKKIIYDVMSKGDSAFLTGDVLVMDEYGNFFFKDRTGDTYRWKGENVSTAEVEAIISNLIEMQCAISYGVEIPGCEGRAGMVAIVDESKSIDYDSIYIDMMSKLPAYAIPLFLRVTNKAEMTGTFKFRKVDYRKDGFDPSRSTDMYYYLNLATKKYCKLTREIYEDIQIGKMKF